MVGIFVLRRIYFKIYEYTHVLRHLQDGQHKEDVLMAVLELLVLKVSVGLVVTQGELGGKVLEVGGDVGSGLDLALEAQSPARAVDLFQQLEINSIN